MNQFLQFNSMDIIAKHRPFKSTGEDFQSSNPIFAYYFIKYYITCIKPIYEETKEPEIQAELKSCFKTYTDLEKKYNIGKSDEEMHMTNILEYTELMFAKNDHYHQLGNYTKQIAEDYLTIFRLYEVVNRFGNLDKDQNKRRVYSKKKFIDIMKELKKNPNLENQVIQSKAPQGELGSSVPSQFSQSSQAKQPSQIGYPQQFSKFETPPQPSKVEPPPVFNKPIQKIEQQIQKSHFKPLPKPSKLISYDKITMQMEATKNLENAISELSFDRYKYARDELMHALELLDQIID